MVRKILKLSEVSNINMFFFHILQNMNWVAFENFIGEEIPQCVKGVLITCGYDSLFSLGEIKETHIESMENYITANHIDTIKAFNCCHSSYYKNLNIFRFLPGHAAIVSAIPKYVEKYKNAHKSSHFDPKGRYSFILEEMIRTAEPICSRIQIMLATQTRFDILLLIFFFSAVVLATKCFVQTFHYHQLKPYVSVCRKFSAIFEIDETIKLLFY